jgi:hypothetical protein
LEKQQIGSDYHVWKYFIYFITNIHFFLSDIYEQNFPSLHPIDCAEEIQKERQILKEYMPSDLVLCPIITFKLIFELLFIILCLGHSHKIRIGTDLRYAT